MNVRLPDSLSLTELIADCKRGSFKRLTAAAIEARQASERIHYESAKDAELRIAEARAALDKAERALEAWRELEKLEREP